MTVLENCKSVQPKLTSVLRMCVLESRPGVQALYVLRFLTAAVLGVTTGGGSAGMPLLVALVSWIFGNMFVYLLNGIMDVTEDRVNGSQRPIASGRLPVPQATRISVILAVISIMLTFLVPLESALVLVSHLALGWLYSGPPWYVKRNPFTAACVLIFAGVCCYSAGYWATGAGAPNMESVVFALGMSLAMGLVGVPVKDLSDIEGDRAAGRRSFPVLWGEQKARVVIFCLALITGLVFFATTLMAASRIIGAAIVTLLGFIAIGAIVLSRAGRGSRSNRRRAFRIFIVSAYCTHFVAICAVYLS
ncbi:UbiA family prenyltransferase [Streptomyces sp. NPDC001127]|uniref:UbiA family prenyltransferase n=1 Tax=Streptomyces sp. NPDC001127 TaxID=3154377 RepID=UPI00332E2103